MKKLYLGVLLSLSFLLGACTSADIDSFVNSLVGIGGSIMSDASAKADSALGNHHHYISLPATPYYSATEIEVRREFTQWNGSSEAILQLNGEIFNQGGNLVLKYYAPIYDTDGKIVHRIRKELSLGSRGIMKVQTYDNHYESFTRTPQLYIPKNEVVLAIYHNGALVGSSHPEMLKRNQNTSKTSTKTNTKKVSNTKTNTKKTSSSTSSTSTQGNTTRTQTQSQSQSQTQTRSTINTSTSTKSSSSSIQIRQSL